MGALLLLIFFMLLCMGVLVVLGGALFTNAVNSTVETEEQTK